MSQTGTQTEIKVRPSEFTPTYNETTAVLYSPNIQSANFRWLVDIYKGVSTDSDYELLSSISILPNPEGFGVIDFHRHIENNISTTFNPEDTTLVCQPATNEGLKWTYELTEKFDNTVWSFISAGDDSGLVTWTSTNKHPYKVGDVINIVQDAGATYPTYDGVVNVVSIVDDYTVKTDKTSAISLPAVIGGLSNLVDTSERNISQTLTPAQNLVKSFNGAIGFQDFKNWDDADYLMSETSLGSTKALLKGSRTIDVTLSDRVWINTYIDAIPFTQARVKTNNGTFLLGQNNSPSGQLFITQNKIGALDLLETLNTVSIFSGSLPVIDSSTTFIEFTPMNSFALSSVGETITLNIIDECSKHEAVRFFYMDKLGSYLPITFNQISRKNVDINRSNYKQNYGAYNSTSNTYGYSTYDRGSTSYDITTKEVITCTSDWVSESTSEMVIDMLSSPNVYIQDANSNYIAINITTNSSEVKKKVNEKLINYTISFEHAQIDTNQRG